MTWSGFKLTLLFAVISAGIAGMGVFLLLREVPDRFQSTATLLLVPLPVPVTLDPALNLADVSQATTQLLRQRVADALALPTDPPKGPQPRYQLSMPDYAQLFRTHEMAQRLQDFLMERARAMNAKLPNLSLDQLRERMNVRTRLLAQTREDVIYQETLELNFQYESPQLAAETANFWAEQCISFAQALRQERLDKVQSFFDERLGALPPAEAAQPEAQTQREFLAALRATAGLDTAEFLHAGEAMPPTAPVSPQRRELIAASALLAAFATVVLAILWQAARSAFPA